MNILAIDTSTETLGICLKTGENGLVQFSFRMKEYRHSILLVPWIEKLFTLADTSPASLSLVVCSTGPGSFTGLRIGLSTAKGLALGNSCPVIGIPTPDGIAWGLRSWPGIIVPVIDARKNRVYAAAYDRGNRISEYLDVSIEELLETCKQYEHILFTGPHAQVLFEAAQKQGGMQDCALDPGHMLINPLFLLEKGLDLFQTEKKGDPDTIGPLYLRKSEAEIHRDLA